MQKITMDQVYAVLKSFENEDNPFNFYLPEQILEDFYIDTEKLNQFVGRLNNILDSSKAPLEPKK